MWLIDDGKRSCLDGLLLGRCCRRLMRAKLWAVSNVKRLVERFERDGEERMCGTAQVRPQGENIKYLLMIGNRVTVIVALRCMCDSTARTTRHYYLGP